MIKKFEEFVNESYNEIRRRSSGKWAEFEYTDFRRIVSEYFKEEMYEYLLSSKHIDKIYSFHEVLDIFIRLLSYYDIGSDKIMSLIKYLFDDKEEIKDKKEFLNKFCKRFNGGEHFPIVIDDYSGKILTGKVWYCGAFDKYAEDENSFYDEGNEYLSEKSYELGYTDDESVDYVDNNWDKLDIKEIDLDEVLGWEEPTDIDDFNSKRKSEKESLLGKIYKMINK
jgi:hypothetical protein